MSECTNTKWCSILNFVRIGCGLAWIKRGNIIYSCVCCLVSDRNFLTSSIFGCVFNFDGKLRRNYGGLLRTTVRYWGSAAIGLRLAYHVSPLTTVSYMEDLARDCRHFRSLLRMPLRSLRESGLADNEYQRVNREYDVSDTSMRGPSRNPQNGINYPFSSKGGLIGSFHDLPTSRGSLFQIGQMDQSLHILLSGYAAAITSLIINNKLIVTIEIIAKLINSNRYQ